MARKSSGRGRSRSGKGHGHGKKEKKVFPQVAGRVQMTREGYIFVIPEDPEADDVFVKASKTRGALNGDTVLVAPALTEAFCRSPSYCRRAGMGHHAEPFHAL